MIKREIEKKLIQLKSKYPVILITGPRQSGKTTLAKKVFKNHKYINIENYDLKLQAINDPKAILELGSKNKIIIDEIQEAPILASYIQQEVDENKIKNQFVLTGSQNFVITQTVSQSLAGRVANLELLPFSYKELYKSKKNIDVYKIILNGFYPRKHNEKISATDFYLDYISTYITRDIRTLKNIGNLSTFNRFLQLLAGRVGNLINFADLAKDVGISPKTIESWISILEASYLIFKLPPYYENFNKRIIKSSKIYFTDTGLLCHLLKINKTSELKSHFAVGNIFENFIIADYKKSIFNNRLNQNLYFYRDSSRVEVDLVIDKGVEKELIEIKSSQTFNSSMLTNLNTVENIFSKKYKASKKVVYNGTTELEIKDTKVKNWKSFLI